jgi:hypothetical protein
MFFFNGNRLKHFNLIYKKMDFIPLKMCFVNVMEKYLKYFQKRKTYLTLENKI